MKKRFFVTGFAALLVLAAMAQTTQKEAPSKPPPPPKPPVENTKDIPPPPPPAPPATCHAGPPPAPPAPEEPPVPPIPIEDDFWQEGYEAFLQRNPSIKSLGWNSEDEVIIHLKSGKVKRYSLGDEQSRKAAEAKYGELPTAPPPPPPPPPPPRRKSRLVTS